MNYAPPPIFTTQTRVQEIPKKDPLKHLLASSEFEGTNLPDDLSDPDQRQIDIIKHALITGLERSELRSHLIDLVELLQSANFPLNHSFKLQSHDTISYTLLDLSLLYHCQELLLAMNLLTSSQKAPSNLKNFTEASCFINRIPHDNNSLHEACIEGDLEKVYIQLDLDHSQLKYHNSAGRTPLEEAYHYGHRELVKSLLKDPRVRASLPRADENLNLACWPYHKEPFLHTLCARNDRELTQMLIDIPELLVELDNEKFTPLQRACLSGSDEVAALLIYDAKVDVNYTTHKISHPDTGYTPLYFAAISGNLEIIKILLKHPEIKIRQSDLQVSLNSGHFKIAQELIMHPSLVFNNTLAQSKTCEIFSLDSAFFGITHHHSIREFKEFITCAMHYHPDLYLWKSPEQFYLSLIQFIGCKTFNIAICDPSLPSLDLSKDPRSWASLQQLAVELKGNPGKTLNYWKETYFKKSASNP
jgi:ankyrin repeat protein